MKKLKLRKGEICLIDDRDFDFLNQWKWFFHRNAVYRGIWKDKKKKNVSLHRVLMDFPKGKEIDHIDSNPLNNQRSNLRICSHKENVRNYSLPRHNKSGYKGVSWNTNQKKWRGTIKVNGEQKFLGNFDDKKQAALAYNEAARGYFNKFAKLNVI